MLDFSTLFSAILPFLCPIFSFLSPIFLIFQHFKIIKFPLVFA